MVYEIDSSENGTGNQIGSVLVRQTDDGVEFQADLSGLPQGTHAAHVHNRPTCAPQDGVIGGAAGAHFGRNHMMHDIADGAMMQEMADGTMMQMMADGTMMPMMAPRGDLAPFVFDADQRSTTRVMAAQLSLDEIRGRSLLIHLGPDMDGKSGSKIACAIIP
jgi:Cu-Zn family superoxide dismutase